MATKTTNYGLTKPAATDYYDVGDMNGNSDIIDTALKTQADALEEAKETLADEILAEVADDYVPQTRTIAGLTLSSSITSSALSTALSSALATTFVSTGRTIAGLALRSDISSSTLGSALGAVLGSDTELGSALGSQNSTFASIFALNSTFGAAFGSNSYFGSAFGSNVGYYNQLASKSYHANALAGNAYFASAFASNGTFAQYGRSYNILLPSCTSDDAGKVLTVNDSGTAEFTDDDTGWNETDVTCDGTVVNTKEALGFRCKNGIVELKGNITVTGSSVNLTIPEEYAPTHMIKRYKNTHSAGSYNDYSTAGIVTGTYNYDELIYHTQDINTDGTIACQNTIVAYNDSEYLYAPTINIDLSGISYFCK